jgi:ubiquinone biosynthesis protein COQ9
VTRGWQNLALADIAAAAKVSLPDLAKLFHSKPAILAAWSRRLDADVLAVAEAENLEGESPRDRLLDVLMLRFDAMAEQKPALKRIAEDLARDPLGAAVTVRPLLQSLGWMLEAAGLDSSGLRGAIRTRGLALVWAAAFRVWLDDGEDQAKTMAELDRRLRQAESWIEAVRRFRGGVKDDEVAA